jgi:hypothetical protein
MHASQLSFDVQYRYSAEDAPTAWRDSLGGSFKMDGSRYWYLLDSTEMLSGDKYVVILYREDKIMYLNTAATAATSVSPVAMLDSFLLKKTGLRYHLAIDGQQTLVSIFFDKEQVYKKMEYYINNNTGLLTKTISVVRADQLYDPSVRGKVTPRDSYAIIETLFRNYHEKSFDSELFNMERYFRKEGNSYVTVPPYTNYKIFLGKPGL